MGFWGKKEQLAALFFSGVYRGGNRQDLEGALRAAISSVDLPGKVEKVDGKVLQDLGISLKIDFRTKDSATALQATSLLRRSLEKHNFDLD